MKSSRGFEVMIPNNSSEKDLSETLFQNKIQFSLFNKRFEIEINIKSSIKE